MNQKQQYITSFVIGLVLGSILLFFIKMLYFVGILMSFIVLMGQNNINIRAIEQKNASEEIRKDKRFTYFTLGLIGYLVAGILSLFFI